MGLLVFHLPKMPCPVESLSKSLFEVPTHREIRISNRLPRLIFILKGTARVRLGDAAPLPLHAGDALVLPHPARGRGTRTGLRQAKKVNPCTSKSIQDDVTSGHSD